MVDKCKSEYSSPFNVNNQLYFCGVPFRLDSYNGCSHGCHFCFVRAAELTSHSRKNRGGTVLVPNTSDVQRTLVTALDRTVDRADVSIEWLRHRVPIHWGGMSDPFQPCERKYGVSKQWMKYLNWYNYPVVFSTKGIIMVEPEYLQLLKEGNYAAQVSLISDNEEFMKALEPGAPSPQERMRALETLAMAGIWTAVRIQPVIPDSIVERELPEFLYKLSKIGVKHIVAEGYKMPVRDPVGVEKVFALAPDARYEYSYNDVDKGCFEKELPSWRKWQYAKVIRDTCHSLGMTYGAADNDLRDLGDTVCCCGIDNLKGFEGYWQYQASQAARIAKDKSYVALEDMQQYWTGGEKEFSVHNDLLKESGQKTTPKFCVDFMWEHGGSNSPECMASMKKATRDGKMVYEYTNPVPILEANHTKQGRMLL